MDSIFVRAKGTEERADSVAFGPLPVDRDRVGTKRRQAVYRRGPLLAPLLSDATVPDGQMLLATIDAITFVRGKRGQPRHRLESIHADKAYDDKKLR